MGVSLADLRQRCQLPVRARNDVAGLLYGDRSSLPVTKLFVDLSLSPDIATIGMLVCGLAGSLLHALAGSAGGMAIVAAALLLAYYVLDCVDGEVARWLGVENMKWGYYDYLFHMLVKPCCFLGVGLGVWRATGQPLLLLAGASAAVSTLWLKMFLDTPGLLFLKSVLAGKPGVDRSFQRFARTLRVDLSPPDDEVPEKPVEDSAAPEPDFPFGLNMVTLRSLATNFDMGLLFLFAACVLDLAIEPISVPGLGAIGLRGAWVLYYGVVLPLDFLDYLQTYVRRGHFSRETERLLALAHHFHLDRGAVETVDDEPGEG